MPVPFGKSNTSARLDSGTGKRRRLRPILRLFLRITFGVVIGLTLLLIALLIALQIPPVARWSARTVLALVNPWEGTILTLDDVSGTWLTALTLRHVRIGNPEGALFISIDTLSAGYDLTAILRGELRFTDVTLRRPVVHTGRTGDGTLMLAAPFGGGEPSPEPSQPLLIQANTLFLSDGEFILLPDSAGKEGGLNVKDISLDARSIRIAGSVAATVDTFHAQYLTQDEPAAYATLRLSGSISENQVSVRAVSLTSPQSSLEARGTISLPISIADSVPVADISLSAHPLAYRDIHPFVPAVGPEGEARIELSVTGDGREAGATARLRFPHGGAVDVRARGWNPRTGILSATISGNTQAFSIASVTGRSDTSDRLNCAFDARVEGPGPEELRGTATFNLSDSYQGSFGPLNTQVNASIADGKVDASVRGTVRRAPVSVQGSIRPFDASPPFSVSGTASLRGRRVDFKVSGRLDEELEYSVETLSFRDLDLGPFLGEEWNSALTGNLSARGRGTDPRNLTLHAGLHLMPSRIGSQEIRSCEIKAAAVNGMADVEASAEAPGGTIRFLLHLDPYSQTPSMGLRSFDFSHIDLGRFLDSPGLSSDLSGRLQADLRFASAEELDRFSSGLPEAAQGGTTGSTTITIEHSRLNLQKISGTVHATLRGREAAVQSELSTPGGGISLGGTGKPFDANPSINIPEIRFRRLDIGKLSGLQELTTDLTGQLSLMVRGGPPDSAMVRIAGDLSGSSVNRERLERGTIRGAIEGGRFEFGTDLLFANGRARAGATGTITRGEVAGSAEGMARFRDLGRLMSPDSARASSLDARITLDGTWGRNTSLRGTLSGRGGLDSLRIDSLACNYSVTGATVKVDTLFLVSNAGTVGASGTIAALDSSTSSPSAFALDARIFSLKPFERIAGVATGAFDGAELRLSLDGPPGQTIAAAGFRNHVAEIEGVIFNSTELSCEATLGRDLRPTSAEAMARFAGITRGQIGFEESVVHLATDGTRHRFHGSFDRENGGRIVLAGAAEANGTSTTVALDTLTVSNPGVVWLLDHPAEFSFGRALRVKGFSLRSGARKITLEGDLDPDGEHDFTLVADSLDLSEAANVLGWTSLQGFLSANARITGPAGNASAEGEFFADVRSAGEVLGTVRTKFGWADSLLSLDGTVLQPNGSRLDAHASIPATLTIGTARSAPEEKRTGPDTRPLDFAMRTDGFDLAMIRPFLSPKSVSEISGTLVADIRGSGRRNAVQASGSISLDSGRVLLPGLGVTYNNIKLDARLDGRLIQVRNLSLTSGKGSLTCTGTLDYTDFDTLRQDLTLNARDFLAVQTPAVKGTATGTLNVGGTIRSPAIAGQLRVKDSYYNIPDAAGSAEVESVELTDDDYAMLEKWFGYRRRSAPRASPSSGMTLDLDLDIALERNTWIRKRLNPTLAIELEGNLSLHSHPQQALTLIGNLRPLTGRSYVGQFGRQFEITDGEIAFNGTFEEMDLRIGSEYKVPSKAGSGLSEVVIRMNVASKLGRYTFSLTSDPAMDEADILSYLATGKSTSGALANTSDQGGLGESVALEQLVGAAGGLTEGKIPLDVFQIRQEGARGITIVAGNYVNPKTYLGIRQPILINQGTQDTYYDVRAQAEVEYEASPWLYLNFQGGSSRLLLFLKSRYAY